MPYKLSFWLAILVISLNASVVLLSSAGAFAWMGVTPEAGQQEQLDDIDDQQQQYDVGGTDAPTLAGFRLGLNDPLSVMFDAIFPADSMLKSLGVPPYIVTFFWTVVTVIPGYDVIKFLRSG